MNHEAIADHFCQLGYKALLTDGSKCLTVEAEIGKRSVTLVHWFPAVIQRMPRFLLAERSTYDTLAHVEPFEDTDLGLICVHDPDSISVNYEVPTAAYEASLERHLLLLEKLITDPDWNREELLREFRTNWDFFCRHADSDKLWLYFACDPNGNHSSQIKRPFRDQKLGINAHYLGLGESQSTTNEFGGFRQTLNWDKRSVAGKTLVLHLQKLEPAPTEPEALTAWYQQCIENLETGSASQLERLRRQRSKEFWLVFTIHNATGRLWFAIQFLCKVKRNIPITVTECQGWTMKAVPVRGLDRDSIVPRSGGRVSLADKSVLLVGCGSVGSELAHRLASTGLGEITLSDPEMFTQDNLYRHTLSIINIGLSKSFCLAVDLRRKYPWIRAKEDTRLLEIFTDLDELNHFDLIVVAIGSPTIERQFHEFVTNQSICTPVMNVWLEAHGIGGHSTLALTSTKGCLLCAYVDSKELTRGLASNLNFLAPNQDFTVSHGGCGNLFLPYSAIASNHTATMAADLASRYLLGDIDTSSKVSWKGNAREAQEQGFELTYRYGRFVDNLNVLPLYHPECDVCGG